MPSIKIILILISGLGVLHGVFLAVFLRFYKKGNLTSNKILSLLLLVLSFRIGKSVFLEFADHLNIKLVFIGLASLMAIGPLFYLYALSYLEKGFQIKKKYLIHFIPFGLGLIFGIWINDDHPDSLPILFFAMVFMVYYFHCLSYLLLGYFYVLKGKKEKISHNTFVLLRLIFFALIGLWLVYVTNLFDEIIPYIVGPILYSLIVYSISFVVILKGYINSATKYNTTPLSQENTKEIFIRVNKIIIEDKEFKNPDISLKTLSERLKLSKQVLSMVINKESKSNFNSFINHHRIKESIKIFQSKQNSHHTIASVAFEVGFNSLSSFNSAFKKQTGKTPLAYRKELSK